MEARSITVIDEEGFENPYRTSYEIYSGIAYFLGAYWMYYYTTSNMYSVYLALPYMAGVIVFGIIMTWKGGVHYNKKLSLVGKKTNTITIQELGEEVDKYEPKEQWILGDGFEWTVNHRQRVYEILKVGIEQIVPNHLILALLIRFGLETPDRKFPGSYWIHGINDGKEKTQTMTFDQWTGNTIFFGTTRAGKSVALRYFSAQAIMRDEICVCFDPKGDKSIENTYRKLAEEQGKPFYLFHLARPEESVRIDPLYNWNRPTELATRIASLMAAVNPNDPFKAFSWKRMNAIISAITYMHSQPNLKSIKANIEGGVDKLLLRTIEYHLDKKQIQFRELAVYKQGEKDESSKIKALIKIYKALENKDKADEVNSIISDYEHPEEHGQKMIASLLPLLAMLTTNAVGDLLSPEPEADDERPIVNLKNVISSKGVIYIGLDGLSDSFVASAVGSILLADLVAVAGQIYNSEEFKTSSERQSINLFIDELSMIFNEPLVNLLNQGAGAGFKVAGFTQTFHDLSVKLGSNEAALKALGNFNNKFAMRTKDKDTLEFIANELPMVSIHKTQAQTNTGSAGNDGDLSGFTGGFREGVSEEEVELFPPNLLPNMPNMEYLGIVAGGKTIKGRVPLLVD